MLSLHPMSDALKKARKRLDEVVAEATSVMATKKTDLEAMMRGTPRFLTEHWP